MYKSDIWDFEKLGPLEGEYMSVKEGLGSTNSKLYLVKTEAGKEVSFWGGTAIDNQMKDIQIGAKIKVTYHGLVKSKKSSREYKNFEVEVWEEEKY